MNLPPAIEVSGPALRAIATRHGLEVQVAAPIRASGIINTVIALEDRFVLRVPRDHPAHIAQAYREATALPLARAAGVHTPDLVAFDDRCDLLPVPYLIVERAPGVDVETQRVDPSAFTGLWIELGRDLARLHASVEVADWPTGADAAEEVEVLTSRAARLPELDELVEARVEDGWLSYLEGRWLTAWVARLGSHDPSAAAVATHGDVQMSNILADPATGDYQALLDWGCAARRDAVADFAPMPFAVVPLLLQGHRQIAPLHDDATAERRILRARLRTLLSVLPRGATPGMSWGERPTAWLIDLFRFFGHPPDDTWRALAPDESERFE